MYTDVDGSGTALDGNNLYETTFAQGELPRVNAFWSLTLYNEGHFFHPNELNCHSLGTKNKTLKYYDDGSLTPYAGGKSLGKEKKSKWLPAPKGAFSLYIRSYWPKKEVLDGTWKPPMIKRCHNRI